MAQIMEFLLNLLLLRGKYLTTTAAVTLHEAFRKCLKFKRKISMEYAKSNKMVGPFDNMLEYINFNASHYTCEGQNYVVTSEVRCRLYEQLSKMKEEGQTEQSEEPEKQVQKTSQPDSKKEELPPKNQNSNKSIPNSARHDQKVNRSQDYIIDNLHAILRSQEFLFKNIIKLVSILERDTSFNLSSKKLEKIKYKLTACTDVLSNSVTSRNFSNIINNIIEDEITRCRFRHGECKTSADISLHTPKPKGIAAALETPKPITTRRTREHKQKIRTQIEQKHKRKHEALRQNVIDLEAKRNAMKFLKRAKSTPVVNMAPPKIKEVGEEQPIDIKDSKKLIEVNEEHFSQFEDALWHSLTSLKFMSLKDDYLNMCKCAFYNKRQFVALESALSEKIKRDKEYEDIQKFLTMSDSVFQIMERRLLFQGIKEEINSGEELMMKQEVNTPFEQLQRRVSENRLKIKSREIKDNPFLMLQEIPEATPCSTDKKISSMKTTKRLEKKLEKKNFREAFPNLQKNIFLGVGMKKEETRKNQETNTIINATTIVNSEIATEVKANIQKKPSMEIEESILKQKTERKSLSTEIKRDLEATKSKFNDTIEKPKKMVSYSELQKRGLKYFEIIPITTSKSDTKTGDRNNLYTSSMKKSENIPLVGQINDIKEVQFTWPPSELEEKEKKAKVAETVVILVEEATPNIKTKEENEEAKVASVVMKKSCETVVVTNVTTNEAVSVPVSEKKEVILTIPQLAEDIRNSEETKVVEVATRQKNEEKSSETIPPTTKEETLQVTSQSEQKREVEKIVKRREAATRQRLFERIRQNQLKSPKKNDRTEISTRYYDKLFKPDECTIPIVKKLDVGKFSENPTRVKKFPIDHGKKIPTLVQITQETKRHVDIPEKKSKAIPIKKVAKSEVKFHSLAIQTVASSDGKLSLVQGKPRQLQKSKPKRSVSTSQIKDDAELISVNKKAFDELENTLHTVRQLINKHSVTTSTKATSTDNKKRKLDEPLAKKFSTRNVFMKKSKVEVASQDDDETQSTDRNFIKAHKPTEKKRKDVRFTLPSEKSKTFSKCANSTKSDEPVDTFERAPLQMRCTKTAMRRQQVLTIFPKVSKIEKTNRTKETKTVSVSALKKNSRSSSRTDDTRKGQIQRDRKSGKVE